MLAIASLASILPNVVLGPFIGALVDRWNRRKVMIYSDGIVASCTVLLAGLFIFGIVQTWHIYIVLLIRATAGSFHLNSMNASTSLMVPVESLTRIQGLNQMLSGGINIVAAPLGALLLELLSIEAVLVIDIITAIIAIFPLLFLQIPQPERSTGRVNNKSLWKDFQEGFRFVVGWPGLLVFGLMTVMINFTIIPAFSLTPLLVKNYFGGGAIEYGWVESAMGIGILLGGGILGVWGGFKRKILTSMLGLMGMGIGTLVMAVSPTSTLLMAIGGAFMVGFMSPVTMGPFYAIVQSKVEPNLQARVFALLSSIGTGITPLGLITAGPISDKFGIPTWFTIGGAVCTLMAVIGLFIPTIMRMEENKPQMVPGSILDGFSQKSTDADSFESA